MLLAAIVLAGGTCWAENVRLSRPVPSVEVLSTDAEQALSRIRKSGDNRGLAFAIVDKKTARLYVFDKQARQLATSPVLLGSARGDESVPGIGDRPLSQVKPAERTTPSGRFQSEPGINTGGDDIVWVDYDAAVSIHRVRASNKAERRLERLATPTAADNRISYGCINVPTSFYDTYVKPSLGHEPGMVYVLPETRPVSTLFDRRS